MGCNLLLVPVATWEGPIEGLLTVQNPKGGHRDAAPSAVNKEDAAGDPAVGKHLGGE